LKSIFQGDLLPEFYVAGSKALRRSNRLFDEKIPRRQIIRANSSVIKIRHGNQEIPEEEAV
jgi:hypothetical protein